MNRMNSIKQLFGMLDIGRLARTYESMNRKELAKVIADASDGMTQVECRDKLLEVEDEMMKEMPDDIPKEAESLIRIIIQNKVVNYLATGDVNDEQKC